MINGVTEGRFSTTRTSSRSWRRRSARRADLLAPGLPPRSVYEAYYDGLPGTTGFRLSTSAWGWHSETAIHVMRLVLSGALDRHPKLKLIIGHMGEGLAAMMVRSDKILTPEAPHLKRSVEQTILDQVCGDNLRLVHLAATRDAACRSSAERVMFSIDYPYSTNRTGRDFLDTLKLPPGDLEKFARQCRSAARLKNGAAKVARQEIGHRRRTGI